MIDMKAFKEWQDLFNENMSSVWQEEPIPILKKLSMLLLSIKNEMKKIEAKVDKDVLNLRKNVSETGENQDICMDIQSMRTSSNKENIKLNKAETNCPQSKYLSENVKVDSPEMFENGEAPVVDVNDSGSIIISDEDTPNIFTKESPEIKKKKRNRSLQKRSQGCRKLEERNTLTMSWLSGRGLNLNNYQNIGKEFQENDDRQEHRREQTNMVDKSSMDFFKGLLGHTQVLLDPSRENGIGSKEPEVVLTPIRHDGDIDLSVVQCTPVQVSLPKRKDKTSSFLLRKKWKKDKSTTLTQMFSRKGNKINEEQISRPNEPNYDSDETYFNPTQGRKNKTSKIESAMGITRMVSYLNTDSPGQTIDEIPKEAHGIINLHPNTLEIANFVDDIRYEDFGDDGSLNSAILEDHKEKEADDVPQKLNDFLAEAQSVPKHQLEAAPVVRGKARQKLPGWSCRDCEKFYLKQGLSPEEILALNKCSKHRGLYRPREDTLPGFWDMNMVTQETENNL